MTSIRDQETSSVRLSNDFWKFWVGQTISNLGTSFTEFVLPLLVFKLSGSAFNLAITTAAAFLPYLFFGLIIGAWTDRVNRKHLMILADIARAMVITSIPIVAALGLLSTWWIYAVAFINSTLSICFDSAQFAAVPSLVDRKDIVTANGRLQASYSAATVIGPLLAGSLAVVIPMTTILVFDSLSFLISSFSLAIIGASFNSAMNGEKVVTSLRQDIAAGLHYVLTHPVLRAISLMMALVNLAVATVPAQLVLFAKEQFLASDTQVGILYSAGSIGTVVLSLVAGRIRKRWSLSNVLLGTLMLAGISLIALALSPWFWSAVLLWALISGLSVLFNINSISLRQTITPNHMLGRVMSVARVLAWSATPLGALVGGFAIEQTGNVAFVYCAIGSIVMLVAITFSFTALGNAERYLRTEKQH